ncbi:ammonium transporter [Laspinema sp. D1]|uniref:Ammonium transporter n=1 Tax=Laspinema palackyanum D2a TaxID=2953684 RepID=A0ABT2MQZ0_9CYAN|nr:ammonium transporter [Laspinema sp. D2b]MCT7967130.1 ammonium transporter [Laspinema sp. D2a]
MTSKFNVNLKSKPRYRRRPSSRRNAPLRPENSIFEKLSSAIGRLSPSWKACIPLASIILLLSAYSAVAQSPPGPLPETLTDTEELRIALDTMWVVIASILVIFMNAGFGMLETGFCRQKNAVNILSKNLIVFALATVAFWAIGFGFMFGDGNPFIGFSGFFLAGPDNSPATNEAYSGVFDSLSWTGVPLAAKFLFQVAFAGTAATIVSGAVAERIKFVDFLIFSLLLVGIAYPLTGHWVWGGGWLSSLGFMDFAGSTAVHSVGGWAALMGAAFVGPRLGKYQDGRPVALPGHNMSIATLGCLILWVCWFGFNPGSTMAADHTIGHIAVTTNIAAATGGIAATLVAWMYLGKPDLSMIINGILAGLVAITAGCNGVTVFGSAIIGAIGGILVVFAVTFFDSIHIDDPVGATSVHLVNGVWGTLAVGLFNVDSGLFYTGSLAQLGIQFLGVASVGGMTVLLSTLFWVVLKYFLGIRVSEDEELKGLDIAEHGMEAYSGFLKDNRGMAGGSP